jgi:hypothetical protein
MRFRNPFAAPNSGPGPARRRPSAPRLIVEPLDDRVVPATLSVGDVTVVEGTSGVQNAALTVTLSEPLKKPVTVDYRTADGTAAAGSDYAAAAGKLAFARGETVKTVLVPVYGDQVPENTEAFTVRLSAAKGATIADGQGTVTVVDSVPRLSVTSEFESEGGAMTFTVSLSAPLDTAFAVNFATADYTADPEMFPPAVAGEDYVATAGALTFAPGETTKTFTVQLLDDVLGEYDEYFTVQLSNPSAPVIFTNGGWGWGVIYDNDPWWF